MKLQLLFGVCLAALGCAVEAGEKVRVSSFSTVLTEIAERVGGDFATVTGHVKPGVDPHQFEPTPGDLKVVSKSEVILLSARHMEGYVGKLKEATGTKGRVVEVGDQFPALMMEAHDHDDGHDHDHGKGDKNGQIEDPHWWHSLTNIKRAVNVVRDELVKASPANEEPFRQNAKEYVAKLDALEKWCRAEVAKLPRNKRKLVTSHDAFQYLAKDFGFTIFPVEGVSSTDQPSSRKVANLIKTIQSQGVKAIFAEKIQNPKVLTEITRETGAQLGGELYADGLGEGDASTIDGMFRHNISTIVNALK